MTAAVAPYPLVVDDTDYNTSYSNCYTAVRQNVGVFHFYSIQTISIRFLGFGCTP
jgi:hypothetical protein